MAVLASINSATYTPRTQVIPFTIAANLTRVVVTLTHANTLAAWPAGPLVRFDWNWGNGSTGQNETGGGIFTEKDGTPTVGTIATTFSTTKPAGVTSGTVTVTNLQTLTAAVLVEGF